MNTVGKLIGKGGVNQARALYASHAVESSRHDHDIKVCLATWACASVALMPRAVINDVEM